MVVNIFILLVAAFSVIYTGLFIYAIYASDSMIFPIPASSYTDESDILKLKTADGESISAYFLEAPGSKDVLFYSHGNGEDIGDIRTLLQEFKKKGISALAYDYPGYGTSSGEPSEQGVYAAAEAAFRYLTDKRGYSPESITLYGRSLGSGPSCWLAERYRVAGLILDGAFSSTFRVITNIKLLPFDKFDNLAILPELDCPVLLIHGTDDNVVPFAHALRNENALNKPPETLWVEGADHNNHIELAGDHYWNVVQNFIRK
ncbi:alpha/beta hydrolase [Coraliomargarita sinensis]|nr:alpha/beta hydrolase [Coraliomargarita sinensis]